MDELLAQFLIEARELVATVSDDLVELERNGNDSARLDSAFRAIHTLKGSVAIFDMAPAGALMHVAEDVLGEARSGSRKLDRSTISALVDAVDQVDRWVDAMERHGSLPEPAQKDADRLIAALVSGGTPDRTSNASWAVELAQLNDASAGPAPKSAFRYCPDRDCFFRGDDPLAVVQAVPGLVSFRATPRTPWPAANELQPFECNLIFEGLSTASAQDLRAALRMVGEQAEVTEVTIAAELLAVVDAGPVPDVARTVRIEATLLDALADDVGELLVAANALAHVAAEAEAVDPALAARLTAARTMLDGAIGGLRRRVTSARMTPIGQALRRLPRLVREAAASLGRDVGFAITGEATEIDKGIADAVFEPLLHLLRNAIDHGIEAPAARVKLGKPERGTLALRAERIADSITIEVSDDGAGIEPARMREVAVGRGLLDTQAARALTDQEAIELIFAPGFSTAREVTEISGRGVGMDAVRATVERLGGRVEISSVVRQGTLVRLRLPLSAVTTRMLTVHAAGERFAVPVERIVETASVEPDRVVEVGLGRAVVVRDRTLPYLSLSELLGKARRDAPPETRVLVTRAAGERIAIGVDRFGEQLDVMLRPPGGLLAGARGLAGTTLLGDGSVLVALDLEELVG